MLENTWKASQLHPTVMKKKPLRSPPHFSQWRIAGAANSDYEQNETVNLRTLKSRGTISMPPGKRLETKECVCNYINYINYITENFAAWSYCLSIIITFEQKNCSWTLKVSVPQTINFLTLTIRYIFFFAHKQDFESNTR